MKLRILVFVVAIAFISGCYPNMDTTVNDIDTVATLYETDLRDNNGYQEYSTFFLPDTVIHIRDTVDNGNNIDLPRTYDEQMIADVRRNMLAYGYTEIPEEEIEPGNLPDIIVLIEAQGQKTFVQSVYCYPGYWGWGGWWGGYPGYPGWGGCGTSIYSYNTGSVFLNILDPQRFGNQDEVEERDDANIWLGIANGLLSNQSSEITEERIRELIDRAFKQSPYLDQNSN